MYYHINRIYLRIHLMVISICIPPFLFIRSHRSSHPMIRELVWFLLAYTVLHCAVYMKRRELREKLRRWLLSSLHTAGQWRCDVGVNVGSSVWEIFRNLTSVLIDRAGVLILPILRYCGNIDTSAVFAEIARHALSLVRTYRCASAILPPRIHPWITGSALGVPSIIKHTAPRQQHLIIPVCSGMRTSCLLSKKNTSE